MTTKRRQEVGASGGDVTVDVMTAAVAGVCTLVWREQCRGDEVQVVRARLSRRYPYPGFIIVVRKGES